jgi:hypothetical protein
MKWEVDFSLEWKSLCIYSSKSYKLFFKKNIKIDQYIIKLKFDLYNSKQKKNKFDRELRVLFIVKFVIFVSTYIS